MIDINRFNRFKKELNKHSEIKVLYKDKSYLMNIIKFIIFFNKFFMTRFITTIGNKVYYPSEKFLHDNISFNLYVLSHEFIHIRDSEKLSRILYSFIYLFPQILSTLAILAIFSLWFKPMLWFLLCLIFILPIPAPWRKNIELRGYKMTLYVSYLDLRERMFSDEEISNYLINYVDRINANFTGPNYFFMWPFGVKKQLLSFVDYLMTHNHDLDETFNIVRDSFNKSK